MVVDPFEELRLQKILDAMDQSSSLTPEQLTELKNRLAGEAIPPAGPMGIRERKPYPRSLGVNGFPVTTTPRVLTINGPFGPIVAMSVDTTDTTSDILLQGADAEASAAIRVRAGRVRRIEFDTPTDSTGQRVASMVWTMTASAIEAGKIVLIEVE